MNTEIMSCWPILSKAFWHFVDLYKINPVSVQSLFSLTEEQFLSYHKQGVLPQLESFMEIVQHFLRIHAHLHTIFGQQHNVVYNWLHVKRDQFDGLSALEFILKTPETILNNLEFVENHLKQAINH